MAVINVLIILFVIISIELNRFHNLFTSCPLIEKETLPFTIDSNLLSDCYYHYWIQIIISNFTTNVTRSNSINFIIFPFFYSSIERGNFVCVVIIDEFLSSCKPTWVCAWNPLRWVAHSFLSAHPPPLCWQAAKKIRFFFLSKEKIWRKECRLWCDRRRHSSSLVRASYRWGRSWLLLDMPRLWVTKVDFVSHDVYRTSLASCVTLVSPSFFSFLWPGPLLLFSSICPFLCFHNWAGCEFVWMHLMELGSCREFSWRLCHFCVFSVSLFVSFWSHFGVIFWSFRGHCLVIFEVILRHFLVLFFAILGSILNHFCVIFVSFLGHFWIIFESFFGHFGVILRSFMNNFWGHYWVIFVSFSGHFHVILVSF